MDTERVLALFAEANPVPDVDTVRSEFGASSADLTTLESRSRIMDTRHVDQLEPADSRQRRLNPALAFAAALVVAFVAVAGGVLLMRGGEAPVAGEPTTTATPTTAALTTEAPTTTALPEAPPSPFPPLDPGAAWEIVASGEMEVPTMAVTFVDGIGWIAVGGPYVMVSDNSADWISGDSDGVLFEDAAFLTGVVAGGPGAIAYGRTCEANGDFSWEPTPCPQEPVLYGSADGLVWERIDDDAFIGCSADEGMECYAGVNEVATSGTGTLLATGPDRVTPSEQANRYDVDTAVWTSADGRSWTRHDIDLASFVPADWSIMAESFDHVVHTGDRWIAFLLINRYVPAIDDWEGQIIVVESSDGAEWTVVDTGETFVGAYVAEVVSGPQGMLAIGGDAVWWSDDGNDWHRADLPTGEEYSQAVALESGFIVASRETPGTMFAFSPDGATWTVFERDDDLTGAEFGDLAVREVAGPRGEVVITLVAVGHRFEPGGGEEEGPVGSAIWRWEGYWAD